MIKHQYYPKASALRKKSGGFYNPGNCTDISMVRLTEPQIYTTRKDTIKAQDKDSNMKSVRVVLRHIEG